MTIKCKLVGMRHHDFKDKLEEFFDVAVGKRVLLQKEDDNVWDRNQAVAALCEGGLLAYVSKSTRTRVRQFMADTGMELLLGTIVRVIRAKKVGESDMLEVKVDVDKSSNVSTLQSSKPGALESEPLDPSNAENLAVEDWQAWEWDGMTMPRMKDANVLHGYVNMLRIWVKSGWNDECEYAMNAIHENLWSDMSREMQDAIADLIRLLTELGLQDAADELEQVLSHTDSPEFRQRLYQQIMQQCQTKEAEEVMRSYRPEGVPKVYRNMLALDGGSFVSRISYMRMPQKVLQNLMTVATMEMRRLISEGEAVAKLDVPIRERLLKVEPILKLAETFPFEPKTQLLLAVVVNLPGLTESDLADLQKVMTGMTDEQKSIIFQHCQVSGNNIVENIQPTDVSKLPQPQSVALLPKKGDEK